MSPSAPIDPEGAAVSRRGTRVETIACVFIALLIGWFYLWTAQQPANSWSFSSAEPRGYYPLQTAGFRSGHLYVALVPLPALLDLKDPYDPAANTPYRAHDMSLFRGRYYLYYGVTPILILFWPVAAITGRYLTEPFAAGLFCSAAIWVGMGLLLAIRRRHFPEAPFTALILGWLCLAWATPLVVLAEAPRVYEVPITCAIFMQALMLAAVYRALHSARRALIWMAVAGMLFGLSLGARPNYLAGFVVLLVPIFFQASSSGKPAGKKPGSLAAALSCTFGPPAVLGIGLLSYNWVRFGSAAEFGIHYQLAAERVTDLKTMAPGYFLPHSIFYLFNAGHWDSYFPFFSAPFDQPCGFLRYVPWAWLMFAAFLWPGQGRTDEREGRMAITAALALAFVANLALLACFFGTTYRYPGDFADAGLILAGVGALSLGQRAAVAGHRKIAALALAGIAAASLAVGVATYVGAFPRKDMFIAVARAANTPAFDWQKKHGADFGGVRLVLSLPVNQVGLPEPLLETGREIDHRDCLAISYLPKNQAQLVFVHAGTPALRGQAFDIPSGRKIVVEARFGSLLPPFGHPIFSGWSREGYEVVKHNLRITVNGADELRASVDCFDASPLNTRIGRSGWPTGETKRAFSGSVLGVARLPLVKPPYQAPAPSSPEPVEISLYLPAANRAGADPLVTTGKGRESDMFYCIYDGEGHIRFALDHFGAGGPKSETVAFDPLVPHTLTVWMGSMAKSAADGARGALKPDRLGVVLDGRTLLNIHQDFYPAQPGSAIVGLNAFGSSEAGREFTGEILGVRRNPTSTLSQIAMSASYGRVEMDVSLPRGAVGTQEPLVVTGIPTAGDFVYVRYVDARHVAIGFDHWGIGGLVGKPIELDYGQIHRISIAFQSLFHEGAATHESDLVRVFIDGRPALVGRYSCYPSSAEHIEVGANLIGGSTCGGRFTGNILNLGRFTEQPE
jgi:hypothetical protein